MITNIINICNISTPEHKGCKNVISKKQLDEIKDNNNTVYLINIHLNWEGNKLSSNYGFNIANLLRTEKKSKVPIIFYSPIQQKYFEEKSKKEIKYKILFGRGSAFKQLPLTQEKLIEFAEKMNPLSNAALHDVTTMLCDLKGIVIDKLNHDLKFDTNIDSVIASVSPYLSPLQRKLIELDKFVAEIRTKIINNDIVGFKNEKQKFITVCNLELTEAGKDRPKDMTFRHKILVLDDVQAEIENSKSHLKDEFIIIEANTGEEAKNILKKDARNEIVAVIADWRLFTDARQDYWQQIQGYEVLEYAAEYGIRSLFALTSQADFVVHHLRNKMGVRFSVFKKENLDKDEQWKVFSDVLCQACEEAVESKASILDTFPTWKKKWGTEQKTLRSQYIDFWNSICRNSDLLDIETVADGMWEYLMGTKDPFLIGEEIYKDYKISIKVLKLQKILVLRRIWFALWFNYLPKGTLRAEKTGELTELVYRKIFGRPADGSIAQRTINLCIQLDRINKKYMLPEEIDWLTRKGLLE